MTGPRVKICGVTSVEDGARGVKFVAAAVGSQAKDGAWTDL